MKQPRLADFDPAAAERELGSPLDGMPLIEKPRKVKPTTPSLSKNQPARTTPVAPLSHDLDLVEKPEKYTTHLGPSLVKKIKLFAVEREMKDYEVVTAALLVYFEKNR
jgi:hypothetical protein